MKTTKFLKKSMQYAVAVHLIAMIRLENLEAAQYAIIIFS